MGFVGAAAGAVVTAGDVLDACADVAGGAPKNVDPDAGAVEAAEVVAALDAGVLAPNEGNKEVDAGAVVAGCDVAVVDWGVPRLGNRGPGCLGCSAACVEGVAVAEKRDGLSAAGAPRLKPENAGGLVVAVWA